MNATKTWSLWAFIALTVVVVGVAGSLLYLSARAHWRRQAREHLTVLMKAYDEIRVCDAQLYDDHPFSADYVQQMWSDHVRAGGFRGRVSLRWTRLNAVGELTTQTSGPVNEADSIAAYRLEEGRECVTGYLYYPPHLALTALHYALLALLALACMAPYFVCRFLVVRRRRGDDAAGDEVRFDDRLGQLVRGRRVVQLTAMPAKLLKALIEAEDNQLTTQEIHRLLWPDERDFYPHRLHSCITRLRQALAELSDWRITNKGQAYQLNRGRNNSREENRTE